MPPARVRKRGVSLIWTAILLLVLIGVVGLATDVGHSLLIAHELQNAADASALAGALQLRNGQSEARLAALQVGAANAAAGAAALLSPNDANDPAGDVVLGRWDRDTQVFTPTTDAPTAVKVVAPRTASSLNGASPLIFGQIFGISTVDISREAIAVNEGGTGGGLIALCPDCECALEMNGTVDIHVDGGDVQVNSSDDCAVCGGGSFMVDAPALNINGDLCINGQSYDIPGDVYTDQPPIPDPLAFLPEPTWDPAADLGTIDASGTYGPGYYSGGVSLTGGDVILQPGIYILDGNGLDIGGNTNFIAEGIMAFIPPGTGYIDINGSGVIRMTPPDPELYSYPGVDVYEYVTIFQSRTNTNESRIIGTGLLDLQGTLYFPVARLEVGGTGDGFGNQLIAWEMWIHGTGDITINYEGSFPAAGNFVFLVK